MDYIELKSYAKINLTLDVKGILPDGMHEVEMVMQQILLCDDISMRWEAGGSGFEIRLTTNRKFLPTDERNLAYKAAQIMYKLKGENRSGRLKIYIKKIYSLRIINY